MGAFILVLGAVYGQLFKSNIDEYLPHLAGGFIVWHFISGLLNEYPNMFVENASYIKDIKVNPLTILFRVVTRHIIIFIHNVLIIFGIYLYFGLNPGITSLLALPGFILVTFNLTAIGVSLSIIGVRFRDVSLITQNIVQLLFFVTPILWFPRLVPEDSLIIVLNPFAYYVDLIRSPLLGVPSMQESWLVSIGTFLFFAIIGTAVYKSRAKSIPYWV
jgi:ABC-type polysaccharide/polyol phosphate export permease